METIIWFWSYWARIYRIFWWCVVGNSPWRLLCFSSYKL